MINYYEILGIEKDATQDQIKSAYKAKAMHVHPDRCPDDSKATGKFQTINKAYETLSDPEKRAQYDRGIEFGIDVTFDLNDAAIKGLRESFITLILALRNIDTVDLIEQSRECINKEIKKLNERNIVIPKEISKLEKARKAIDYYASFFIRSQLD